jgi:peroxiredoxin
MIMKRLSGILGFMILSLTLALANPGGPGLEVGDEAPDFKLQNVDGEWVSLSDFEDAKGYIVIFTCNSCPYSVLYEDRIIELHEKYADRGYPVIAINPNDPDIQPKDSYDMMKVRADEKGFDFPYVFDAKQEVFPAYGASRTPHVFLLDNKRVVQYIGAIDDNAKAADEATVNYVDNAIMAMDSGKKPDPEFTKAIGCTIKVKS